MLLFELIVENIDVIILFDQIFQCCGEVEVVVICCGYYCEMCLVKGYYEFQYGLGLVIEGRGQLQDYVVLGVL